MTEAEAKKAFVGINFDEMNAKVTECMMDIVQLHNPEDGHLLFKKAHERFTHDELTFLVCMHIAERFKEFLQKHSSKLRAGSPVDFDVFLSNLKK
jgi:hypothetical protein